MRDRSRVNFIVDDGHRLITIRPIGVMTKSAFVEEVFEAYARLSEPWTYRRVRDLRRWEGQLDQAAETEISSRWAAITGTDHQAFIAVVTADASDQIRMPRRTPDFPNETKCDFTDYHEAVGWLLAEDRDVYLAGLGPLPFRRRDAHQIRIE